MVRRLRRWAQLALLLLIVWFWGRALAQNWQLFADYSWQFAWRWMLLSLLLLLGQMVLLATIWWRVLVLLDIRLTWRTAAAIWLQTQIARYLPGGVWDIAGRVAMGRRHQASGIGLSASLGLEMGLHVLSAASFLVAALLLSTGQSAATYLPLAVALAMVVLIGLSPRVYTGVVNTGLRLLKRPSLTVRLTFADLLQLFLARLFAHGLLGVGFFLFARSLAPVPVQVAPLLISGYVGAWLAGYLALFVPTGIGVREGVLVLLVGGALPFSVVTVAALGYRLWLAVRDLLAALLGAWLGRHPAPALSPSGAEE